MAVDLSKKADISAVPNWEEAEKEKCWEERVFDALDRLISPRILFGFFAFAVIYILYHLAMFCLRINGWGF